MIYIPILSALSLGIGTIFEKITLRKKGITPVFYTVTHFIFIILAMLPFIFFYWYIDIKGAFLPVNLLYFLIVILFALLANIFTFKSFKKEKLTNLEPARALEPLFVIILAILFSFIFTEGFFEKNTKIIIPAFIAGAALVFSHIKKNHLYFSKPFIFALLGSFFFALELIFSKLILNFYSPLSFYFLRCSAAFILGLIIFRPKILKIKPEFVPHYFGAGISWVGYRVLMYYGFQSLGVIFTTLVLMLGPIIIFTLAHFILKERMNWKNIIASLIIVICVVYAVLV